MSRSARTFRWTFLVAALAAAVMLGGCGSKAEGGSGDAAGEGVSKPSLQQYFDADAKTADFVVYSTNADGKSYEMSGTLWVDGRKFRYDLYQDGKLVRSIMSPDGKTAYFAQHAEKVSEPSVASVDRYLLEFAKPSVDSVEDGTDKQTGATRVLFPVKKTDNMKDAANPWYTEDIVYLVKGDEVIGVITRGDTPNDDGTYDLDTARRMFSNLRVGAPIPADTFELPYPIKAANQ